MVTWALRFCLQAISSHHHPLYLFSSIRPIHFNSNFSSTFFVKITATAYKFLLTLLLEPMHLSKMKIYSIHHSLCKMTFNYIHSWKLIFRDCVHSECRSQSCKTWPVFYLLRQLLKHKAFVWIMVVLTNRKFIQIKFSLATVFGKVVIVSHHSKFQAPILSLDNSKLLLARLQNFTVTLTVTRVNSKWITLTVK